MKKKNCPIIVPAKMKNEKDQQVFEFLFWNTEKELVFIGVIVDNNIIRERAGERGIGAKRINDLTGLNYSHTEWAKLRYEIFEKQMYRI